MASGCCEVSLLILLRDFCCCERCFLRRCAALRCALLDVPPPPSPSLAVPSLSLAVVDETILGDWLSCIMMGVRWDTPTNEDDCRRRIDTSIGWRNDDATGQSSSSTIIGVLLLQLKLLLLRDRETIIRILLSTCVSLAWWLTYGSFLMVLSRSWSRKGKKKCDTKLTLGQKWDTHLRWQYRCDKQQDRCDTNKTDATQTKARSGQQLPQRTWCFYS